MFFKIHWRQEGDTTVDAKDEESAKDMVIELLDDATMPEYHDHTTEYEDPELLSCEEVE